MGRFSKTNAPCFSLGRGSAGGFFCYEGKLVVDIFFSGSKIGKENICSFIFKVTACFSI